MLRPNPAGDERDGLDQALAFARDLGWPVFPVWPMRNGACACGGHRTCGEGRNAGKHPISSLVPNGHTNATTDPDTIRRWWTQYPDANIGLWCAEAGLVVVDIDPRNGGDASWTELGLPDSPVAADTGGGGVHQFYAAPPGEWRGVKLAGIDLKHNGYVILPPSNHRSGRPYAWRPGHEPETYLPLIGTLPPLPDCFIDDGAFNAGGTYTDEPLTDLDDDDAERWLGLLNDARWADYHSWFAIGTAIHHQYRGAAAGLEMWERHSAQRPGYKKKGVTAEKWKTFGRNSRIRPTTFRTVIEWAKDDQAQALINQFDEVESGEVGVSCPPRPAGAVQAGTAAPHPLLPAPDLGAMFGLSAEAVDDIDALESAPAVQSAASLDWMSLLATNVDGTAWANNLHNVQMIVANDPRLAGLPQFNEFTHETVQRRPPGRKAPRRANAAKPTRQLEGCVWEVKDPINGDLWSDDHDFAIRSVLEAPRAQGGYAIKVSDRDLKAAVTLVARENPFHPVREYLESVEWDGVERVERLFIDFLGASDNPYTRGVARLMMIGAVTRIYEPAAKFDFSVILEGLQGKRKSTFIKILGRRWFAELDGDFHDSKQMIELMQGAWILEIPELSSFGRADVRAIKAFVSRQTDRARLAYARRAREFPRQCIFIGSTNDRKYLKDDTGGRRFWPMPCTVRQIDTDRLEREVDQLWAEATHLYRAMRRTQPGGMLPLHLTGDALEAAEHLQESRRVETPEDALAGQIADWLDKPISDGGFDDTDVAGEPRFRNATCLVEIWCECIGNDRKSYISNRPAQLTLGSAMDKVAGWSEAGTKKFDLYGTQRVYVRGGRQARIGMRGEVAKGRSVELVGAA